MYSFKKSDKGEKVIVNKEGSRKHRDGTSGRFFSTKGKSSINVSSGAGVASVSSSSILRSKKVQNEIRFINKTHRKSA